VNLLAQANETKPVSSNTSAKGTTIPYVSPLGNPLTFLGFRGENKAWACNFWVAPDLIAVHNKNLRRNKRVTVRIANPSEFHGKKFTSMKVGRRMLRQSRAVLLDDGSMFVMPIGSAPDRASDGTTYRWRGKPSLGFTVMQAERVAG
jgi:hypothetical protein